MDIPLTIIHVVLEQTVNYVAIKVVAQGWSFSYRAYWWGPKSSLQLFSPVSWYWSSVTCRFLTLLPSEGSYAAGTLLLEAGELTLGFRQSWVCRCHKLPQRDPRHWESETDSFSTCKKKKSLPGVALSMPVRNTTPNKARTSDAHTSFSSCPNKHTGEVANKKQLLSVWHLYECLCKLQENRQPFF